MESKINLTEEVPNKGRTFGSLLSYYPVMIVDSDGHETPALFTRSQIKEAKERAARNPEDIPEGQTFFEWLFGG